jgi:hypothetical protein
MADKKISALTGASTPLAGTEVLPIVQGGNTVKVSAANITAGRAVAAASLAATDFVSATNYVVAGTTGNIALLQPKNIGFYNAGVTEGTITCSDDSSAFVSIGLTKTTARIATGNVDRLSINSAGNVTVDTGNLVIGTAGKGIDFTQSTNAAGMTSELLNDYEEGTWTPASLNITLASSVGFYTKIGRSIFISGKAVYPATGDGNLAILTGLPFTPADNGVQSSFCTVGYSSYTASYLYATPHELSRIYIRSSSAILTNADMSSKEIHFGAMYYA